MCVCKALRFLRRLYLNGNLLEVVPTNLPSTLQELKISDNKLRGIDENSFRGTSGSQPRPRLLLTIV